MKQFNVRRWVISLVFGACCVVLGASLSPTNQAHGEVRGTAEAPAFERSGVPVLREISATLRQMDARLARLEAMGQKLQASATAKAVTPADENN
jgi:hypothetical protein